MPERILTYARIALALAGAFAFGAAGYVLLAARPVVRHLDGVLTRAEGVESKLNATAVNLDHATAEWAASSKTEAANVVAVTGDARRLIQAANSAVGGLQATIGTANAQLASLGPGVQALLVSARTATDALPPAIGEIQTTVADLRKPVDASAVVLSDLHAAASNPDLAETLRSTAAVSSSAAHMMAVTDKKWTAIVDPPPCVGRTCWIKRTYQIGTALLDIGAKAAPTVYWLQQLR